jgi:hypothetical protein
MMIVAGQRRGWGTRQDETGGTGQLTGKEDQVKAPNEPHGWRYDTKSRIKGQVID